MKRNKRLRGILLHTLHTYVYSKGLVMKVISCGYFLLIKEVYRVILLLENLSKPMSELRGETTPSF